MAAIMRLRISLAGEAPYEVNVTPKVIVSAERNFGKPMSQLFGENASFEALCWTAWKATTQAGKVVKPFEEWLDSVDAIDTGEEVPLPLETP
jgi:hypothetical protein